MEKEKLERICCNCNQFFPASMEEATEFGICLSDETFEPYIEELLDKSNYSCCHDLIENKKFPTDQEACSDYEEAEVIEIENDSPLAKELSHLSKTIRLNLETLKVAILEERIRKIDWKTMPVDEYANQLKDPRMKVQRAGIASLGGMISFGNKEAFKELFRYFKQLVLNILLLKKFVNYWRRC